MEKKTTVNELTNRLPVTFTPALLDKLFQLNDGGKTVRRHLRKHFAEQLEHNHKDKWTFTREDIKILEYFLEKYTVNFDALAEAPKPKDEPKPKAKKEKKQKAEVIDLEVIDLEVIDLEEVELI